MSVTRTTGCLLLRRPRHVSARLSGGSFRSTGGRTKPAKDRQHVTYEQMVVEAQSELRRLREALLGITVKGPNGSAPELERIVASAQELWDGMLVAKRESIGEEPQPWLLACDSLVAAAQSWAQQHSSPPHPRTR